MKLSTMILGSLVALSSSMASADVVCIRTHGADRPIKVRPACGRSERSLGSFDGFERLLAVLSSEEAGATLRLTGVNLQIVSGSGATDGAVNGVGNLIVGYNEPRDQPLPSADHGGSHNIVVGHQHRYRSYGGLVVGEGSTLDAEYASVTGGLGNTAAGRHASVSGGAFNQATEESASISGGIDNQASGLGAAVTGGGGNVANDEATSISGGQANVAGCESSPRCTAGRGASVSGGWRNHAVAPEAWIGGGYTNLVTASTGTITGGVGNQVTATLASIHGGQDNVAGPGTPSSTTIDELYLAATVCGGRRNQVTAVAATISGGANLLMATNDGWAAGSLGGGGPFIGPHRSE